MEGERGSGMQLICYRLDAFGVPSSSFWPLTFAQCFLCAAAIFARDFADIYGVCVSVWPSHAGTNPDCAAGHTMPVRAQAEGELVSAPVSDQVQEVADLVAARGWVERQDRCKLE